VEDKSHVEKEGDNQNEMEEDNQNEMEEDNQNEMEEGNPNLYFLLVVEERDKGDHSHGHLHIVKVVEVEQGLDLEVGRIPVGDHDNRNHHNNHHIGPRSMDPFVGEEVSDRIGPPDHNLDPFERGHSLGPHVEEGIVHLVFRLYS